MMDTDTVLLRKRLTGLFGMLAAAKGIIIVVNFFPLLYKKFTGRSIPFASQITDTSTVTGVLFVILLNIVAIAVPALIWFAAVYSKPESGISIPKRKPGALEIMCGAALTQTTGYIVSFVFTLIGVLLAQLFGIGTESVQYSYPEGAVGFILLIVYLAVCPALFEELMFRGAFLNGTKKWGTAFAIGMTSVTFSMMHNTITQLPFALVTGICISYLVIRFDSIYVGIVSHFFVNFNAAVLSYLFAGFYEKFDPNGAYEEMFSAFDTKFAFGIGYMMLLAVFLIVFTVMFFIEYGIKPLRSEKTEAQTLAAVLTCPTFYVFAAEFVFVLVYNISSLL